MKILLFLLFLDYVFGGYLPASEFETGKYAFLTKDCYTGFPNPLCIAECFKSSFKVIDHSFLHSELLKSNKALSLSISFPYFSECQCPSFVLQTNSSFSGSSENINININSYINMTIKSAVVSLGTSDNKYCYFDFVYCPAGFYCPNTYQQLQCKSGSYCPQGSITENKCQAGYYCPNPTYMVSCNSQCNCPAGSTTDCEVSSSSKVCFPEDAVVYLSNNQTKMMKELSIGDEVLVSANKFSQVFMFSHKYADVVNQFVLIKTENNNEIHLTADHYIYVNDGMIVAKLVKEGDYLIDADNQPVKVVSVSSSVKKGLYNPHTLDGNIVVNGFITSTYTAAINPQLAHSALAPVRMLYENGVNIMEGRFNEGNDFLVNVLPKGSEKY